MIYSFSVIKKIDYNLMIIKSARNISKGSTVLVTGGAGYIGSHVNKLLYNLGYKTIVLDSLIRGNKESIKWGKFKEICLSDKESLNELFEEYDIDTVMHFAAFAYVEESVLRPDLYYYNNVSNTINLLDSMINNNVNKIIFSSTCAIFGIPKNLPITENEPKKPINPYGKSKLMVEKIINDYSNVYNLKYINLRYFNVAGCDKDGEIGEDHNPETHLIPRIIKSALTKEKVIEIYGNDYDTKDGTCVRDYIHVEDLAMAHVNAMDYLNKNDSDSFNIGIGNGYSILEVIECIENIMNLKFNKVIKAKREGDPPVLFSDNTKSLTKLDWTPQYYNLKDIINSSINWINNN